MKRVRLLQCRSKARTAALMVIWHINHRFFLIRLCCRPLQAFTNERLKAIEDELKDLKQVRQTGDRRLHEELASKTQSLKNLEEKFVKVSAKLEVCLHTSEVILKVQPVQIMFYYISDERYRRQCQE